MNGGLKHGFSLVEVLVVVSTVSLVMAVTMPALTTSRSRARAVVCRSNLRQIVLANIGYSNDHEGFYVPASEDFWKTIAPMQAGLCRWHGKRTGPDSAFDPLKGPLAGYLADGKVKKCPEIIEFTKLEDGAINFERGCGGYGYNMQYLGSRLWQGGIITASAWKKAYAETTNATEVKKPAATLMFADTAFYQNEYLIEYSFAEPPYLVINGTIDSQMFSSPSIHFRHYGLVNAGWADGHIEAMPLANMDGLPINIDSANKNIGWFSPLDNTLFDLE